ncbi:MAG: PhoH family protein [Leptospirales bacterium]|nr:PhoH family protein [Leptospirales bacterium]
MPRASQAERIFVGEAQCVSQDVACGPGSVQFDFVSKELFQAICGVADRGIAPLEQMLGVQLIPRGQSFHLQGEAPARLEFALAFFRAVQERYQHGGSQAPDDFDLGYLFQQMKKRADLHIAGGGEFLPETIFTAFSGRPIQTRTRRQNEYVHSILGNPITLCLGPAGSGKTFLSIAAACRLLQQGEHDRLVITRPAVEAGESLGFLPGDLAQKVEPYLRPIYDALYECMGFEKVNDLMSARRIEIAPLAYMRGRTLNESIIILDEGQNCTLPQLKMFLTRLGRNSRICLSGDVTQIDLPPGKSGLLRAVRLLRPIDGVGVIEFQSEDIIRNPLVERIVRAFEVVNDQGALGPQ